VVPADLNPIFVQFQESNEEPPASSRAVGLGQSIAKELVSLNYGTMRAEHEPGVKSNWWFSVPVYDPLRVFDRYLQHEGSRQPGLMLSIIHCRVPAEASEEETGNLDCFFQCLLRRHDIVFRTDESGWVLILPIPVDEISLFLKRMHGEFEIANTQYYRGSLPPFTACSLGSWKIPAEQNQAKAAFQATFRCPPAGQQASEPRRDGPGNGDRLSHRVCC
jgi:hypothetical protein